MAHAAAVKKRTIFDLQARVDRGEKVFQVTAVDFPTAQQGDRAGPYCAGQNLVLHDMVGLLNRFAPNFVKRYANCWDLFSRALTDVQEDVRSGGFPTAEHSFAMKEEAYLNLMQHLPQTE